MTLDIKDLKEAVEVARKILEKEPVSLARFTHGRPGEYHHGFGTFIRNQFGLWASPLVGTPLLVTWFRERGILHPDDMSGIILDCLHRQLNLEPWRVKQMAERYLKHWDRYDPYYAERLREALGRAELWENLECNAGPAGEPS